MTGLLQILKIYIGERLLITHYMIKHLILLKMRNTMDIKGFLLQLFIHFLIKKLKMVLLKVKLCQVKN